MKFFVMQTYNDKGHVRCTLLTAEEAEKQGYYDGYRNEGESCDTYVDSFDTIQQARRFMAEAKKA